MQSYPELYNAIQGLISNYQDSGKSIMSGFSQLHSAAAGEGVLSAKHKELIALGIAIAVRCDGCIAYHIADALKAGAKRDEIVETIGVSVLMGGGPALMYGVQAFEALKQFEDNPASWA